MRTINTQLMKFILGAATYLPLLVSAEHVVIENGQEEAYVLQVGPQDTFLDVVNSIHSFNEGSFSSDANHDSREFQVYKLTVASKSVLSTANFSKKVRSIPRSYAGGVTASESADIAYILKTMANSSLPKIKSAESALKKAGDRIDHVHPLHFLACIFSNEELKVCMRNLQGRAWVWKEFLGGITESMAEEDARGNLLPFVQDFAAKVKTDAHVLIPILEGGRWERFVNTLIELVPREKGSDRYNM